MQRDFLNGMMTVYGRYNDDGSDLLFNKSLRLCGRLSIGDEGKVMQLIPSVFAIGSSAWRLRSTDAPGERAGQRSIRINEQWRICFRWEDGHAYDVEIVDYH